MPQLFSISIMRNDQYLKHAETRLKLFQGFLKKNIAVIAAQLFKQIFVGGILPMLLQGLFFQENKPDSLLDNQTCSTLDQMLISVQGIYYVAAIYCTINAFHDHGNVTVEEYYDILQELQKRFGIVVRLTEGNGVEMQKNRLVLVDADRVCEEIDHLLTAIDYQKKVIEEDLQNFILD